MSRTDLTEAVEDFDERLPTLKKAKDYYYGETKEVFASKKLRRALQRTGTDFRINYARVPVDAVLNRLSISTIHVDDDAAAGIISDVWQANELDFEINEVHRNALIYGDSYLMVWLDETDPDNPQIVITYESPRNVKVFYDPENPRRKTHAVKMWAEGDKVKRANLYYADRIEKWEIDENKNNAQWQMFEESENPFGVIPLFHFRTRRPHGRPEHKDAWGIQDMINKIVITQMASNDYQGFPQRYALANPDELGGSSDFDDFDEDGADSDNVASLHGGPGELWYMKGVKEVGQFSTADAKVFLEPLKEYVRALAATTDTPIHLFEGLTGTTSGEHIRAAEAPLNKKVENRQLLFGKTWEEVFTFILSIFDVEVEINTSVIWKPSETVDTKDAWEVAKLKMDAGVPFEMVMAEQGYSPEEIDQMVDARPPATPPALGGGGGPSLDDILAGAAEEPEEEI